MHMVYETQLTVSIDYRETKEPPCAAVVGFYRSPGSASSTAGRANPTTQRRNCPFKESAAQAQDSTKPAGKKAFKET